MSEELDQLQNELKEHKAQLFDVREEDEWDDGHLLVAHFVPLSELKAGIEPDDIDISMKTYLYCKSGRRVHMAKPLLEGMGFENIIPLSQGFEELAAIGFEVE